jgi:hypothetical protein
MIDDTLSILSFIILHFLSSGVLGSSIYDDIDDRHNQVQYRVTIDEDKRDPSLLLNN